MTLAVELSAPVAVLGLIVGTTYGLLAVGLVLVHRSSRVINFAHGDVGAFAAAVLGVLVLRSGAPYYVTLLLAIAIGAGIGMISEATVMRRLAPTPPIVKVVATIGIGSFLQVMSVVVSRSLAAQFGRGYPSPPWFPAFDLGPVRVTSAHTAMLVLTPIVVGGLAVFVQRSRFGAAIRAAADNPDAARLAGVSTRRMSALSWALAGGLSAYTAVLLFPTLGIGAGSAAFGPGLLLRALAAAVIARMTNLPLAFLSGLAVGVIEQQVRYNSSQAGPVNVALLVVILGALALQRREGGRHREGGDWLLVQAWPPLPAAVRRLPAVRALSLGMAGSALAIAVLLGIVLSNRHATILTSVIAFSIIGLGVGLISGLAGQLSLGQSALAGIGAAASFGIAEAIGNFVLAFAAAGVVGAAASLLLGAPAVRIRGLMFAVATLAFAQVMPYVLGQSWLFSVGKPPGRPIIGSFALDTSKRYYYFALLILLAALFVTRNVWSGSLGRRYRAVRDNEQAALAFSVSATRAKLEAFAIGGFITGVGGALYAHSLSAVYERTFPLEDSLAIVAVVAVGGIGFLGGPILGALYIIALPRFIPLDEAGLAATSLGWLLLILQFPGGIAQVLAPLRERVLRLAIGDLPAAGTADEMAAANALAPADGIAAAAVRDVPTPPSAGPILSVEQVVKAYGGVKAVDGVSLDLYRGETLGLIGPNGAGKTTLFELIGGFTPCDGGRIVFEGRDITGMAPHQRARLGLVRSFQDAALFSTLTVTECVQLSLERRMPTNIAVELSGVGAHERRKLQRAGELIELMGLTAYRDKMIGELSTGTRRITELACLLALEPTVLLLDEPTSGIAQRETEALGGVLSRVKEYLGTTLVVIEHDMPLIMGISGRIIALASGQVLTEGTPAEVQVHPAVVESYLGSSSIAIDRSDAAPVIVSTRCRATTKTGSACTRTARDGELCAQHANRVAVTS